MLDLTLELAALSPGETQLVECPFFGGSRDGAARQIYYAEGMHAVLLPDEALPATLRLNPDLRLSDDEFYDFCMANPDIRFERTAKGEIVIVPPVGLDSNDDELQAVEQLRQWASRDGRGKGYGISAEFILSTGAAYAPDAAWVSNQRLARLSKEQKQKFPPVCPKFIIEVMSPSDRLEDAQKKLAGEGPVAGFELDLTEIWAVP